MLLEKVKEPTGSVYGFKWNDENKNGIHDFIFPMTTENN